MAYAGEISCTECWSALSLDKRARLVDVRTQAEWNFVGMPDLSGLEKRTVAVEWQSYPAMQINSAFVEELIRHIGADDSSLDTPLFFLCRSGARSLAAAKATTASGFRQAFNVSEGFEGALDSKGHRGNISGWKFDGLPWKQG